MGSRNEFQYQWLSPNGPVTLSWVGKKAVEPARVYALAFVSADGVLMVSGGPDDPGRYLPGGGVEAGETPEEALARELREEADATIVALEALGVQRMVGPGTDQEEFHSFYWCRVTLADQVFPKTESTLRYIVPVPDFLDTFSWGRRDPKAPYLLELALAAERR